MITAANNIDDPFLPPLDLYHYSNNISLLRRAFQSMLEYVASIAIVTQHLNATAVVQNLLLHCHNTISQGEGSVEFALLFQGITQKALTVIIGRQAAARYIAHGRLILFAILYHICHLTCCFGL